MRSAKKDKEETASNLNVKNESINILEKQKGDYPEEIDMQANDKQ